MQNVFQFFQGVRSELAKVVWPKWPELVGSTIIVLILVIAFSLYLGIVDYLLSKAAQWLFLRFGM